MPVPNSVARAPLRKIVRLPENIDEILDSPQTLKALAYSFYHYEVSRRQVPEWICERVDHFDGEILFADGTRYVTYAGEVDDAFDDDPSMHWISDLYRYLDRLPKQKPHERVRRRMLLLIMALMIEHCFIRNIRWREAWGWWPGLSFEVLENDDVMEARLIFPPVELAEHTMTCFRRCPLLDIAETYRAAQANQGQSQRRAA